MTTEITLETRFDDEGHSEQWRNEVAFQLNVILIAAKIDKAARGYFFPKSALSIVIRVARFEEIQVKQD